jgi:hypothetical protein
MLTGLDTFLVGDLSTAEFAFDTRLVLLALLDFLLRDFGVVFTANF